MEYPIFLTKNSFLANFSLSLGLAIIAFLAWRFEMTFIVGWQGLDWVYSFLYSPSLITILVTLATLLPFYIARKRVIDTKIAIPIFLLFVTGILSYYIASIVLRLGPWAPQILYLSIVVLVNAIIFYFTLVYFVQKVSILYILGVIVAIIAVAPLSDFLDLDIVKAGVPFFWIVFNMGIVSTLAAKFAQEKQI